jgi:hypothetical protein
MPGPVERVYVYLRMECAKALIHLRPTFVVIVETGFQPSSLTTFAQTAGGLHVCYRSRCRDSRGAEAPELQ